MLGIRITFQSQHRMGRNVVPEKWQLIVTPPIICRQLDLLEILKYEFSIA